MKKIRGYKKSDMLYPDRGMIKWAPMLLSDHSEDMQTRRQIQKDTDETLDEKSQKHQDEFLDEP